ncbi:hypothetical protein GPECTOR_40g550 [Gonium pectorale]|uniref:Uncharacterized protein n=1 Tax=Gonium pectorale TaxID=33097 RepID=A0A150GAD9_GONPE|nr:hypothetical protein GPECTOR_40g550 [Gonium pectorale]|eukprot:KXZ46816.1 hypothetical protein GPECTOR_40g550 [Gonium pectorale]
MQGGIAQRLVIKLGPDTDGFQGWGRLSLSGALPLPGLTDPRVSLHLADRGGLAETRQEEVARMRSSGQGTLPAKKSYASRSVW